MESAWKSKSWLEVSDATQKVVPSTESVKTSIINDIKQNKNVTYVANKKAIKNDYNSDLKFLYTNADQLINKRDDLIMRIADDEPDIMLITEVIPKCQSNPIAPALLHIDGYNYTLNFDPNNAELGQAGIRGVSIYSRKTLQVKAIEFAVEGACDHVWIEIPRHNGESILCGCIYRTQSGDTNMNGCIQSTNAIRELITKACQYNKHVIIAGDFNYRNIDWENQFATNGHRHLEEFIDTLQECFLFQHVTEPTRYRENEASNLLDLILSSEEGMVKDLSYHPPLGQSDHICLRFKVQHYQKNGAFRPKRNVFKSEYSRIKDELMENDWLTVLNSDFKTDYDNFTKITLFST